MAGSCYVANTQRRMGLENQLFQQYLKEIGNGDRSFSLLRLGGAKRPLTAHEQIADQIEEDIAKEVLKAGTYLRESQLSERFGVSRGPIRDALRVLSSDGLLRIEPNKGAAITHYSLKDMRNILKISWPICHLVLTEMVKKADDDTWAAFAEMGVRVNDLLEKQDSVAFALATALLCTKQAYFALGKQGEKMLQIIYRPSIRYTITGLDLGAPTIWADTQENWQNYLHALSEKNVEMAVQYFIHMLRDIQSPILQARQDSGYKDEDDN